MRTDVSDERTAFHPLRIVLVDGHEVVRNGLRDADDVRVVGEASAVSGAVETAGRVRPDLVVVDARLTNGGIGSRLALAEKTVENYVSTILSKLGMGRRAEAAAYLARHSGTPGDRD
jgi:DNA-binding NarL/FixJ family response regulator